MLKTTGVDLAITDPIIVDEDSILDGIGNSNFNRANIGTQTAKSKS